MSALIPLPPIGISLLSLTVRALVGFEGGKGNKLISLGSGSGGLSELLPLLQEDMVGYALLRTTEQIDDSTTVKFVFINWVGPNINRMHRARLGTYRGGITNLFAPYHVDLNCEALNEISEEIIIQRVKEAAGTANKVKS
jgi:hypothetical protein